MNKVLTILVLNAVILMGAIPVWAQLNLSQPVKVSSQTREISQGLSSGDASLNAGLNAFARGHYSEAEKSFQQTLNLNPENQRARLELGRVYFAQKRYADADRMFAEVLNSNPPPKVRDNVLRVKSQIADQQRRVTEGTAEKRPSGFSLKLRLGAFYDTNINFGPQNKDIAIAPLELGGLSFNTLTVSDSAEPDAAVGLTLGLSLSQLFELNAEGWSVFSEASVNRTLLEDHSELEILVAGLTLGPRFKNQTSIRGLNFTYNYVTVGDDALLGQYAAKPYFLKSIGQRAMLLANAKAELREYDEIEQRDSTNLEGVLGFRKAVSDKGSWMGVQAGLYKEDAEAGIYSNDGFFAALDAQLVLSDTVKAMPRIGYRSEKYEEREIIAPEKREDDVWEAAISFIKQWNEKTQIRLQYYHQLNESTFDLYEFDQGRLSLDIIREI